jgi:hypothetical protein
MNIEDLIILLVNKSTLNHYDQSVAISFYTQIYNGTGFTEKQRQLALTMLSRNYAQLSKVSNIDIADAIANPVFRLPIRKLTIMKHISISTCPIYGKVINIEFPFDSKLVEIFRKERANLLDMTFDQELRVWRTALNERALPLLTTLIVDHGFTTDAEFGKYAEQFVTIRENLEKYIPMVTLQDGLPKFLNVSKYVPQPHSTDIIEVLFEARKSGIHTWDYAVSAELEKIPAKKVTMDFLNQNPGTLFTIDLEENTFSDVVDLVKFIGPTVFVIPGATELEKTSNTVEHLLANGIAKEEISVLFRLPKETGEKFNTYVKDMGLNNPISANTRAVFVSGKVPKPMIDSGIQFESIVNFSIYSVHYTLQTFIKNHHNVIHVLDKNKQRNMNFANL